MRGSTTTRIALVGAGTIAHHQVQALERLPGVGLIGVVDPRSPEISFRGEPVPVSDSLPSVLNEKPDVIVVAAPSQWHVDVVRDLLGAGWRGPTLVEKPMATTAESFRRLQGELAATESPVGCLYHARFAPEVAWGADAILPRPAVRSVEMSFCDPYGSDYEVHRRAALGSPWLDSGINALSVLDHWLPVDGLRPRSVESADDGLSLRVWAEHDEADQGVELWVSWRVTSPSKASRIEFMSGETLVLDHQATAGRLRHGRRLLRSFASDDRVPRLTEHYVRLFEWLSDRGWRAEPDLDGRLHTALFAVHPHGG